MASFGQEIKPVNADKFFVAIPQQDACMQKAEEGYPLVRLDGTEGFAVASLSINNNDMSVCHVTLWVHKLSITSS